MIFLELLCLAGITGILMYGKILDPILERPRNRFYILKCALCLGVWVGFLYALIFKEHTLEALIIYSFASSAFSYAFWQVFPYFEEMKYRLRNKRDE